MVICQGLTYHTKLRINQIFILLSGTCAGKNGELYVLLMFQQGNNALTRLHGVMGGGLYSIAVLLSLPLNHKYKNKLYETVTVEG